MVFHSHTSIIGCILAAVYTAVLCSNHGVVAANPVEKTLTPVGCVAGGSSPDCPMKWHFSGGNGYVGQRVGEENTKIMCSPSCTARDGSVDKECSLIMVLHGIYSNPADMVSSALDVLFHYEIPITEFLQLIFTILL